MRKLKLKVWTKKLLSDLWQLSLFPGLHSETCCVSSWGNMDGILSLPESDSGGGKLVSKGIRNASSSSKSSLNFHNMINLNKDLFLIHVIIQCKLESSLWGYLPKGGSGIQNLPSCDATIIHPSVIFDFHSHYGEHCM